jgi:hypothetical protein
LNFITKFREKFWNCFVVCWFFWMVCWNIGSKKLILISRTSHSIHLKLSNIFAQNFHIFWAGPMISVKKIRIIIVLNANNWKIMCCFSRLFAVQGGAEILLKNEGFLNELLGKFALLLQTIISFNLYYAKINYSSCKFYRVLIGFCVTWVSISENRRFLFKFGEFRVCVMQKSVILCAIFIGLNWFLRNSKPNFSFSFQLGWFFAKTS